MFNFNNIGKKIKTLAEIICVVGALITVGLGVYYIGTYIELNYHGQSQNIRILIEGIIYIVLGPIVSWISCFLIYGFGELIDATCEIKKLLDSSNKNGRDWLNK